MGGKNGWYSYDQLLTLRGIFSGGYPRLRSDDKTLKVGDKVDFFEVVSVERNRSVVLKFVMGILEGETSFYLEPIDERHTRLFNITKLKYKNWFGKVYWTLIKPFDHLMQQKMLSHIKKLVEVKKYRLL
ncbi:MAG: DUF2867 domain-containing protein [Candidatus Firestonebacteria bacterium]